MAKLIAILLQALAVVESAENPSAIGDEGCAIGILQITESCVNDVNRVYDTDYKHMDAFNPALSEEIATAYLLYWGQNYRVTTGKEPTMEVLARIWNGGPTGYNNPNTKPYWDKVKRELIRTGANVH